MPFPIALNAVLRPLDLTYRVENGVYYVMVRRPEEVAIASAPPAQEPESPSPTIEKIQLNYANPRMIAEVLGAPLVGYAFYELGMLGGFGGFGGFAPGGFGVGGFGAGRGFGAGGGLGGFGGFGFGGFGRIFRPEGVDILVSDIDNSLIVRETQR